MTRLLPVLLCLGTAVSLAGSTRPSLAAPAIDCHAPRDLIEDDPLLPKLAERIRAKQPIVIVAIGGASTAGAAAGGNGANAYPHWLEETLRLHHPGVPITVINKGVPSETTDDMVNRFPKDVYPQHPTLVIWETGIIDAARGRDVEDFAAQLQNGIAALREHNSEVMVVDMQYNSGTASVINFEPYLDAMQRVADLEDAYLFRRFEIMKYWSDTGVFDFVDVPKEKRAALAGDVYKCLGERLADAIDYATR